VRWRLKIFSSGGGGRDQFRLWMQRDGGLLRERRQLLPLLLDLLLWRRDGGQLAGTSLLADLGENNALTEAKVVILNKLCIFLLNYFYFLL
jgi:hypothetical protein